MRGSRARHHRSEGVLFLDSRFPLIMKGGEVGLSQMGKAPNFPAKRPPSPCRGSSSQQHAARRKDFE